jgi:hypothetical protein
VAADALAVTRSPQKAVDGWAGRFRETKQAEKAAKGKA